MKLKLCWYCAGCSSKLKVGLLFMKNELVIVDDNYRQGGGRSGVGRSGVGRSGVVRSGLDSISRGSVVVLHPSIHPSVRPANFLIYTSARYTRVIHLPHIPLIAMGTDKNQPVSNTALMQIGQANPSYL